MSKLPDISVIIPVYGVEAYIARCVESIKSQTFKNFEVLLINDGTKDRSLEFAVEAIAGDGRFNLIHKENGGQGSARNRGLDAALGKYIAFVDADDWVESDYLQLMYEKIVLENADVCTCDVRYVSVAGEIVRVFKNDPYGYRVNNDYLMIYWYVSNFMWDKLFKAEMFEGVRFDESMRTNEDVFVLFKMLYGKKVVSVSGCLYNYLQRPSATSKGAPPTFVQDRIKIKDAHIEFARKIGALRSGDAYLDDAYLRHFLLGTAVTLSLYSSSFKRDVNRLILSVESERFTCFTLFKMVMRWPKVAGALLLFKVSPLVFCMVVRFFLRRRVI